MDIETENVKLMYGDCLERMKEIESGSVDLIVCDLPYGTIKGMGLSGLAKEKGYTPAEWDSVIDTDLIMKESNRILRKNGKMVLFAQHPFTYELISKAIPNLPFNYSMVWEKDHFSNCLLAKKAPVNYFEDILVFSKASGAVEKSDYSIKHPLRFYFNNELTKCNKTITQMISLVGCSASHYFTKGNQFRLPTEEKYKLLQSTGSFNKSYTEIKDIHSKFKKERDKERLLYLSLHNEKYPSTFNLWDCKKFKSNILKYKKDYDGFHPTQKPVLLLEDLIKTFSNECNLIVDMTMGSGSTGVACVNTGRKFIGIELDPTYYGVACGRVLI